MACAATLITRAASQPVRSGFQTTTHQQITSGQREIFLFTFKVKEIYFSYKYKVHRIYMNRWIQKRYKVNGSFEKKKRKKLFFETCVYMYLWKKLIPHIKNILKHYIFQRYFKLFPLIAKDLETLKTDKLTNITIKITCTLSATSD